MPDTCEGAPRNLLRGNEQSDRGRVADGGVTGKTNRAGASRGTGGRSEAARREPGGSAQQFGGRPAAAELRDIGCGLRWRPPLGADARQRIRLLVLSIAARISDT